jgi:molecular chaperone GrpE
MEGTVIRFFNISREHMADEKEKIDAQTIATDGLDPSVGDAQSTVLDQAAELAKLREQLEAKAKEASENYDRYIRQVAELENFRKRASREREEAIRFANEALVKDLLPVVDNLERAVAHAKDGGNGKPLVEGVEMVLRGFFDTLAKHGVVPIAAVGQRFDPEKHEAMAQIESGTYEPNTVVEEYHKGYLLRDRLLRPALVSVAKTPKSQGKKNNADEVENEPGDD